MTQQVTVAVVFAFFDTPIQRVVAHAQAAFPAGLTYAYLDQPMLDVIAERLRSKLTNTLGNETKNA
ncbi:hypothetical protein APT63_08700 [Pseudomonas sp. 22-AL-CL-001]|nr:hypothetical protein APT63_08700 [Pseudomonas monteilii]